MNKKILFFSTLSVLSIFLIPTFIGLRNFGDIFSYTIMLLCFYILGQRIKLRDSLYALALGVIITFFLILFFDYLINKTVYDRDVIGALICFYIAFLGFGIVGQKKK